MACNTTPSAILWNKAYWLASLILLILVSTTTIPAQAQVARKTDDNRISTKLSVDGSSGLYQAIYSGNSFVSAVELDIEWWTLFGEIVYAHKLKWERSNSFRFGESGGEYPITRDRLSEYPDLLKRFDALTPEDIQLTITFYAARDQQSDRPSPSPNLFELQSAATQFEVKLKKTPYFQIPKPGENGFVLSPGRPKDWQTFMMPIFTPNGDVNTWIKNTWTAADSLTFDRSTPLKVTKIVPPTTSLNNIAAEYWRRKKEEKEEEDDFWDDKEDADEEEVAEEDDFWNEAEKSESNEKSDEDDFWKEAEKSDEDDFWACPDQSNDCWKKPEPKVAPAKPTASINNTNGEIVVHFGGEGREDDRYAVLNANGQAIIPFTYNRIYAYENGRARATQLSLVDKFTTTGRYPYPCTIFVWFDGEINKFGHWVGEPETYYAMRTHKAIGMSEEAVCDNNSSSVRTRVNRLRSEGVRYIGQLPQSRDYDLLDVHMTKGAGNPNWYKRYTEKIREVTSLASQTFEIVKNDNREWGVRGVDGRMLIPFSKRLILYYKDGIAKAAEQIEVIPYTCVEGRGAFRGAALKSAYFIVWAEGLIDQKGKWIIAPTKKGYFSGSDRRCRKFIPRARDHARANNIKITEDYEEYANIIGKMDGWRE
ncbi:WG repeat-containing protein [Kordiimonas sp. SCSIO 12610]|uniref:WG repeat-containing protein n=1 Tax=Kordiimonas sp. SCSIO 12610 TaxID=2829597 RepID=UPI00210A50E6|nr:WG repeat-containing protein [Kordiimonas sp. SCSIO 12610]UTW54387.1 WG repeat-containing protein [Kordiimonas sp. SCSIO 12610]